MHPGTHPGMTEPQQDRPGCLWLLGGALVGAVVYLVFRARLALGLVLLVIWFALLSAKGPHHGINAALGGVAFFAWLVLRVRRFVRVRREKRASDDGYYEG